MTPGEIVTCSRCGARSEPLHTTGGRRWEEGGALIVTWTNYAHPRHDVVSAAGEPPALCLPCDDRRLGFPEPRSAGGGPCTVGVQHADRGTTRPDTTDGFKAPLERFADLAAAYHEATGSWPPGKDNPAAVDDEAAWKRWTEWCRARAAAQAPKAKPPRGHQLGLFGAPR